MVIAFVILGYCTTIWLPFRLPWSADVALTAVIFYYAGNITRSFDKQLADTRFPWKIVIICTLAFMIAVLSNANGKADMNYNYYGNMLFFLSAVFSGIYFSYFIIRKLPTSHVISYISQNTIILVGLARVSSFIISGFYYLLFRTLPTGVKTGINDDCFLFHFGNRPSCAYHLYD